MNIYFSASFVQLLIPNRIPKPFLPRRILHRPLLNCLPFPFPLLFPVYPSPHPLLPLLFLLPHPLKSPPNPLVMPQLLCTNARHQLPPRLLEIPLLNYNLRITFLRQMIEEIGYRYRRQRRGRGRTGDVVRADFIVNGARLPCDGLEHGVRAQRVHVCARVSEGEGGGDAWEGEGGVEGEPVAHDTLATSFLP